MKVVHINRKDIEHEKAMLEAGRELMRHQAQLIYKNWLKRRAKRQAQEELDKKHGITKPSMNEIIQLEARGRALLELAREMRKRL